MFILRGASASVWTRSAFVIGLLTFTTSASAEWRRVDSPNFVVVGDAGAKTLRDIAIKFEGFRETLSRVLSDRVTSTAVPTVVLVFPSDRAFTPFKPTFRGKAIELDGLFLGRPDVNYIALKADSGGEGLRVVFHEYAHLLIANIARNIPAWLNEGLAEYYSTYEVRDGGREAHLGNPPASHVYLLNEKTPLPLNDLLRVDHDSSLYNEGDRRSVFYAQSWALTHMLLLGDPPRVQQLGQYLARLGGGMPPFDAWQQVFGAQPIEKDLQNYVRQRSFSFMRYRFPEKLTSFDATARSISPVDAEGFLADFLVQLDREGEGVARLAKATATAPHTAWSSTVAALADIKKKDYAAAEKRLLSIEDAGDWLTAYRAGVALVDAVEERGEEPSPDALASARRLFAFVEGSGHEIPNGTARLLSMELATRETPPAPARMAIERARLLSPGRLDYVFLHARLLAAQSEFASARTVLAPLMTPAYPPNVREPARTLMGYIVRIERAHAARYDAGGRPDATPPGNEPAPPADGQPAERPGVMRPIFRTLEPGESRLEGALERIECLRTGAVFLVRTTDGPVRVVATRMEEVQFFTFREDLTGIVRCGPMKDAPPVYVTWKAGAEAGSRVVVAIEFLPK